MTSNVDICVAIFVGLSMVSCGQRMAPDCNDDRTKQIVLEIVEENSTWSPSKEEAGKTYSLSRKYTDGKLKGEAIGKVHEADRPNKYEFELALSYVRPEKIDKEIGKHTCAARVTSVLRAYSDSMIRESTKIADISYTSEFADGKTHHMSSARLTGEWKVVSLKEEPIAKPQTPQKGTKPSELPSPEAQGFRGGELGTDRTDRSSVAGYTTYTNGRFGFRIDYPQSFVIAHRPDNGDGVRLTSPDGQAELVAAGGNNSKTSLKEYFDIAAKDIGGEQTYRKIGKDWFVVSSKDKGRISYLKMFVGTHSHNSFWFTYPESKKTEYDAVVIKLEKSFKRGDTDHAQ